MNKKVKQRQRTMQKLLSAVESELLSGRRLTAEGVALAAKTNKALLYRYFGGLPGLIRSYASDGFMPGARELLEHCPPDMRRMPARKRFALCLRAYIEVLAARPATVQILLRLPGFDAPTLKALQAGRARGIREIKMAFGKALTGVNFDTELAFNLLVSGACCLLGARRAGWTKRKQPADELASDLAATVEGLLMP